MTEIPKSQELFCTGMSRHHICSRCHTNYDSFVQTSNVKILELDYHFVCPNCREEDWD